MGLTQRLTGQLSGRIAAPSVPSTASPYAGGSYAGGTFTGAAPTAPLAATTSGSSTCGAATINLTRPLAASSAGKASASATLGAKRPVAASGIAGKAAVSASIILSARPLAATVAGKAAVAANLTKQAPLAASLAGKAAVSANVARLIGLAARSAGIAAVVGNQPRTRGLSAAIAAAATASASLARIRAYATTVAGKAAVTANLTVRTLTALTALTASRNQLAAVDSEFETGIGNWTAFNGTGASTLSQVASPVRAGTSALAWTITSPFAYQHAYIKIPGNIAAAPGDYVRVKASVYLSRSQHVQVRVDFNGGTVAASTFLTALSTAEINQPAGQWIDLDVELGPAPASTTMCTPSVQLAAPQTGDVITIDSVYAGVERSAYGQAAVTATLKPLRGLAAQTAGSATATAAIGRIRTLAASSAGKATVTTAGNAIWKLTANIQGKATAGASVAPLRAIRAQIAGLATVVADLTSTRAHQLAASVQGQAAVTGTAVLAHLFSASAAGKAATTAKITPFRGLRADTVGSGNQLSAVNSSFETGIGNWLMQNAGGASTLATSNVRARTGTSSLLWTVTTPAPFMHPFMSYPSAMPVAAGRYVVVAASIYLSRAQHVQLRADFVNGLNGIGSTASAEVQTPAGQWVDMVVVLGPVPAGAIGAVPGVQLAAPQAGDTVNIDAVSISVGIAAGGVAAVTGNLNVGWKLTGQIQAGATVTGKSWPLRAISAQCAGVATVHADLARQLPLTAAAVGLATAVANLTRDRGLAAELAGGASTVGDLLRDRGLSVELLGEATVSGEFQRDRGLRSTVQGSTSFTGDVAQHVARQLSAAIDGVAACTSDLSVALAFTPLSASTAGHGRANGDLTSTFTLAANIAGLAWAMGRLGKLSPLAGAADGQATFVASLRRAFQFSVVLAGHAVLAGDVTVLHRFAAQLLGEATTDGALGRIRQLETDDLVGVADVTGDLPVWHPLDAQIDGVAEVVAQKLRRHGAVPVVITTSVERTAVLTLA